MLHKYALSDFNLEDLGKKRNHVNIRREKKKTTTTENTICILVRNDRIERKRQAEKVKQCR